MEITIIVGSVGRKTSGAGRKPHQKDIQLQTGQVTPIEELDPTQDLEGRKTVRINCSN